MNRLTIKAQKVRDLARMIPGGVLLAGMVLVLSACQYIPQTADDFKKVADTVPVMLFALMMGSFAHGLIQTRDAKNNGTPMSFLEYWSYGREIIIAIIINLGAFAAALLADQMTLVAAFTLGISGNALADTFKGGRSADLTKPPEARG